MSNEAAPSWIFAEIARLVCSTTITKLRLSFSRLEDDPLSVLARLSNLLFLQLNNAYKGKIMRCCCADFLNLKIFIITELEELEEWDVVQGAMPCVQEVWIMSCAKLIAIPAGYQSFATLRRLRLLGMPSSFLGKLRDHGDDFVRVKHIPSIQIIQQFG